MFIWLIPFFSLFVSEVLINSKLKIVIIIFSITIIFFTLFYHIYSYNEKNYPFNVVKKVKGSIAWPPNLNRPLKEISEEIKKYNKSNVEIGYSIDGSMIQYYFRDNLTVQVKHDDLKILTEKNLCENKIKNIKILISMNTFPKPCSKIIKKILKFNNSNIVVFLFN